MRFSTHTANTIDLRLSSIVNYSRLLPHATSLPRPSAVYLFLEQNKRYCHLIECCHLVALCCTRFSTIPPATRQAWLLRNYVPIVRYGPTRWTDFDYIWHGTFHNHPKIINNLLTAYLYLILIYGWHRKTSFLLYRLIVTYRLCQYV
jgi:hypothetical protein